MHACQHSIPRRDIIRRYDISSGMDQHYKARNTPIPTFPYTETPILPPDLYKNGMTSKEGLQQFPDTDPFVVVKAPRLYRTHPTGLQSMHPWLRSTWVLRNGQWTKIEDRVDPLLGDHRFDNWAERAVFQFHQVVSHATPSISSYPRLALSIADLFHPQPIVHPHFINALPEHQVKVINALLRIVHGGRDVTATKIAQLKQVVSETDMSGFKNKDSKDYWIEEGSKLVRVHNKPRSKLFVPNEAPHPTISNELLKDERRTIRTSVEGDNNEEWKDKCDNWRIEGGKKEGNKGLKWTGRTVFSKRKRQNYVSAPSIGKGNIKTIPLKDMFFVGQVTCEKDWGRGVGTVTLIMNRKDGKADRKFKFESNDEDFELVKLLGDRKEERTQQNIVINMWEIADDSPRLVLLCSEESNWFTTMNAKRQEKLGRREGVGEISTAVITITIHDDLNSDYGLHKAALSLRDERDTMFFAGPCTGGSSWARLNRARGPSTEAIIDAKVEIFQQLWNRFETLFIAHYDKGIGIYMELPRGCQYWNNDDVKFLIEGTISKIHDFDGCCYGLRQKFGDNNMYINKPWRIVSWNVEIGNKLSLKCDGRHEHAPCAGRETIHTQLYTSKIISIILDEHHRRSQFVEHDAINLHGAGSSRTKSKKCVVAATCILIYVDMNNNIQACSIVDMNIPSCMKSTKCVPKHITKRLLWARPRLSDKISKKHVKP